MKSRTSRRGIGRYSNTERVGINAVSRIVVSELDWIFREQLVVDMGIDAHIELVEQGTPTGKLLALQIKTGASHFRTTPSGHTYYGDLAHLDYWLGHALPVVLVAHFPESDETLWVHVTEQSIVRTTKGWHVLIPKEQQLGGKSRHRLEQLFEGTPAQQRLRRLWLDLPLMRCIGSGSKVSVELEDWVNKSLGRTSVQVFVHDEFQDAHSQKWFTYFAGYGSMQAVAAALFPWAEASIDVDFYDIHNELPLEDLSLSYRIFESGAS